MKKIVVFTDFSERAENAATYAYHLSRELQANLILYHAYLIPSSQPYAAQVAWPLMNSGALEITSRKELELAASKLSNMAGLNYRNHKPNIETRCDEGDLTDNLTVLQADKDVVLFIMANHHKGFSSLIMGNQIYKMLETAMVPVLIIPDGLTFKSIHKIAFATDLHQDDLEVLHSLATLARHTDATVMLAHIYPEQENEKGDQAKQFLLEVSNKINYPHVYFRHIKDSEVHHGLKWVTENVAFDMLVMVHRHKNFLERLFSSSNTQKAAAAATLPLLVYPHPAESYPIF